MVTAFNDCLRELNDEKAASEGSDPQIIRECNDEPLEILADTVNKEPLQVQDDVKACVHELLRVLKKTTQSYESLAKSSVVREPIIHVFLPCKVRFHSKIDKAQLLSFSVEQQLFDINRILVPLKRTEKMLNPKKEFSLLTSFANQLYSLNIFSNPTLLLSLMRNQNPGTIKISSKSSSRFLFDLTELRNMFFINDFEFLCFDKLDTDSKSSEEVLLAFLKMAGGDIPNSWIEKALNHQSNAEKKKRVLKLESSLEVHLSSSLDQRCLIFVLKVNERAKTGD